VFVHLEENARGTILLFIKAFECAGEYRRKENNEKTNEGRLDDRKTPTFRC